MQPDSASNSHHIDEEEAALYDRQIRLWGLEAQNRLRSASVLIINFRGLAAEVAKNIVLAGINRLVILDDSTCTSEDLGANFFLSEGDVGKMRAEASIPRLRKLNTNVKIEASVSIENYSSPEFLSQFDLICLTDSNIEQITSIGKIARQFKKRFHAAGSFGLNGYIFSDQGVHDYVVEKEELLHKPGTQQVSSSDLSGAARQKVSKKENKSFVSFDNFVENSNRLASTVSKRLQKKLNPHTYSIFVLWEYQRQHANSLPDGSKESIEKLQSIATTIVPQLTPGIEFTSSSLKPSHLETLSRTADTEYTPSCAVVGGVLAQDILNVLGGREAPLANFFVFDGTICSGDTYAVGM